MTTIPTPAAVTRVVDYEPPLTADPGSHRRRTRPRPTPGDRHLHAVPDQPQPSPHRRAAAAFADAALRTLLEVMDQRRSPAQVRPFMIGGLADTVVALTRANGQRPAAAVLRRVRLEPVDPQHTVFEVAAVYSRGPRAHALACRIELVPTLRGARWLLVALDIG